MFLSLISREQTAAGGLASESVTLLGYRRPAGPWRLAAAAAWPACGDRPGPSGREVPEGPEVPEGGRLAPLSPSGSAGRAETAC